MMTDMDSINDKTKAAVKFTRADAVKLVAGEMVEQAASDVGACKVAVARCADAFRAQVCDTALLENHRLLVDVARELGMVPESMCKRTTYKLYLNTDPGDTAEVIFSDVQASYDARLRLVLTVRLSTGTMELRRKWQAALEALAAAVDRDLRVGAMTREAREILIKSALDSSDEGIAVVKAIRALAAALRSKA